jgi:site-specific recombinase XerD
MNRRTMTTAQAPPAARVIRVWRSSGIAWSTIRQYRRWVRLFRKGCQRRGEVPEEQLTEVIVDRWVTTYGHARWISPAHTAHNVHSALWAWSWGLQACGFPVPPWFSAPGPVPELPPLLAAFAQYRREVQGIAESTILRDLGIVQEFLGFLRRRGQTIAAVRVKDIDRFLEGNSGRLAPKTLARLAYALRSFFRFLYTSGRIPHDLAVAVASPRVRRADMPPRALPWPDVRRILKAINRKTRIGQRDYALLLMMAVYGLGAGEVLGLTPESVDWRRRQVQIVRPKTGRQVLLPLLPGVAQALIAYLRHGRPRHCTCRALFVRMHAPYGRIRSSSAIRHVLHTHARSAGVSAAFLGSHVLRHSHACRQIDLGASATVVGDILGHRRPESTSAYVRVALRRLRGLALLVPR